MKRKYNLISHNFVLDPRTLLNLCKSEYLRRYPDQIQSKNCLFSWCIVYLVIEKDKTLRFDFKFPQESILKMKFIHKRPYGGVPGEPVYNTDFREITDINIPPYQNKYYFDFFFFVCDINTDSYWAVPNWTWKLCTDSRYYLSKSRKQEYKTIGRKLAKSYNLTFILGHVNLNTRKLKSSQGIRKIINHGWIPTISLLPQPYGEMINIIERTNDIKEVNDFALKVFNAKFLETIIERWKMASLVKDRWELLQTSFDRFNSKDYISTIHILLPQIEGLITAHVKRKQQMVESQLEQRFSQFGDIIKSETYNTDFTRYLTDILVRHLKNTFYKQWYPFPRRGRRLRASILSPQRHVILHGEVHLDYFNPENCLKLICILDAIILLSLKYSELSFRKT
jgi:hypothetical protein